MRGISRSLVLVGLITTSCGETPTLDVRALATGNDRHAQYNIVLEQDLVNDAPLGPGEPQPSDHCPAAPGRWVAGSGRSTANSEPFGTLTETEVYCINAERSELSGGLATWIDVNGDSISMRFSAQLLIGSVYTPAPNAPMVGIAQFTGGTGTWEGITGVAFLTGRQNGDGSASIRYEGTVYVPR